MRTDTTKKALTEAYETEIRKAFEHYVDGLATAGEAENDRKAAGQRFKAAVSNVQDAYARALELLES